MPFTCLLVAEPVCRLSSSPSCYIDRFSRLILRYVPLVFPSSLFPSASSFPFVPGPAFWSNGPNWPYGGEIDILEGVNDFSLNQVSIHTGVGCRLPGNVQQTQVADLILDDSYDAFNCDSYATANQGCGTRTTAPNTLGAPYNTNGGGVYASKSTTILSSLSIDIVELG
jgi:hypothetical protein